MLRAKALLDLTSSTPKMAFKIPKDYKIEFLDPKKEYQEKMAILREEYRKEAEAIEAQQANEIKAAILKEEEEKQELLKNFEQFKQTEMLKSMDVTVDPEIEHIHPQPKLTEKSKEWQKMVFEKRQNGLKSVMAAIRHKKEQRMNTLLHLFHCTSNYVTYSNMDKKISDAFASPKKYRTQLATLQFQKEEFGTKQLGQERQAELEKMLGVSSGSKPEMHEVKFHLKKVSQL
jgi:hypothetical protein